MVTALPDAVCVAFGFHSSIDAWKLCVFDNFTAKHLLQDGSPNYMCKGKGKGNAVQLNVTVGMLKCSGSI